MTSRQKEITARDRVADMHADANKIVNEWKAANGLPMLSPEASRDLAKRIFERIQVWEKDHDS